MGVSDLHLDTASGPVVDLSAQGIPRLESSFTCSEDTHTLILDRNNIMKLDHLEKNPRLQQLSVASNRLVRMMGVSRLTELKVLNLPNNSIGYIEGLRDLPQLEWLNLSGNNIKVIEQLNNCVSLQHLDLSDNNISNIGDLTKLPALKTLLLHGNSITTLRTVPAHLPVHLSILSLAENEIRDLNEVSYLSPLQELEQLSIMSNPCVMATPSLPEFDYRPYIMSWCLSLKVLDGYVLSQKEGLKAEWLYSQGKGRTYRPGQHMQLVQYLASVCPLTASPALETAEDAKLEKILSKQRFHQRQLLQQTQSGSTGPPRPTQLDVERHSHQHIIPRVAVPEERHSTASVSSSSDRDCAAVQYNNWMRADSFHQSVPVIRSPRGADESLCLDDLQTDEDKLSGSLLSSESTFLPISLEQKQGPALSESEDETEAFEPDSLAPERPPPTKPTDPEKTVARRGDERDTSILEEGSLTAGYDVGACPPAARTDQQQSDPPQETSSDCGTPVKVDAWPKQEGVAAGAGESRGDGAAVRIQSWWRGMYTRKFHPIAREVRSEIRLRRMQEHILFLSGELDRMQKQYDEERLQRLVQEEAVKFLWKQLQSVQQWQHSVEEQLTSISKGGGQCVTSTPGLHIPAAPVACSTTEPACTEVSFPDSGFQSTSEQQAAQEDSFLSSGTVGSLETVRALALVRPDRGGCTGSPDCSLLEQYLSSVQQREDAEEGVVSHLPETPEPASPSSQLASPYSQSALPSFQSASPHSQPVSPHSQPASPHSQPASPHSQPASPHSQPASPHHQPASPHAQPPPQHTRPPSPHTQPASPCSQPNTPLQIGKKTPSGESEQ